MEDTHVALTILNYLPVTHTIPSPDKKSDDPSTLKKKIPTKISHEKRKVNFIEGSGKSSSHSLNEYLFCDWICFYQRDQRYLGMYYLVIISACAVYNYSHIYLRVRSDNLKKIWIFTKWWYLINVHVYMYLNIH